jgi:hypothetical protein
MVTRQSICELFSVLVLLVRTQHSICIWSKEQGLGVQQNFRTVKKVTSVLSESRLMLEDVTA